MADWHGGSTLGGYPLVVKMATDGYLTRFSGRTLINSSILDDGNLATLKNANVTGAFQVGINNTVTGLYAIATGISNTASGEYSHAEGFNSKATAIGAHAEGGNSTASANYSHSEGNSSIAAGIGAHAEGGTTNASGSYSHAEGEVTRAIGQGAHAEGGWSKAGGNHSHAEGYSTMAFGRYSHTEGMATSACRRDDITAFNTSTNQITINPGALFMYQVGDTVGWLYSIANGYFVFQEATILAKDSGTGVITVSTSQNYDPNWRLLHRFETNETTSFTGEYAHVEGILSAAHGSGAHAEGSMTFASGDYSHTEGQGTKAQGGNSHAEGLNTLASGSNSHAEGTATIASGQNSHSEGERSTASGRNANAKGIWTIANVFNSQAMGQFNKTMTGSTGTYGATSDAFVIGNGTTEPTRGNGFRVTFNGSVYGLSAFNSSGADYAEYFEWADGNPDNEDRVGFFVTLIGDKIRKALADDDYITGVISASPSVIGDSHCDDWYGKYVRDDWGRIQYQEVLAPNRSDDSESETEEQTEQYDLVPLYNPDWNSDEDYISREHRKEWSTVGMMGKLLIRDDGTCQVNGFCRSNDDGIATVSTTPRDGVSYRVMKRVAPNIIQILIK